MNVPLRWALIPGAPSASPPRFCGVVGLKPTYGLVSRYGLVAFASSLDQIGPLTRTVEDAAIVLGAIAGHDPRDSTSLNVSIPDYTQTLKPGLDCKGRKVGIIQETFGEGLDPVVDKAVRTAVDQLEALGAEVTTISCPQFRYGVPAYYIIAPSEASSNLARYDGVKYGVRSEDPNLMSMYTKTRAEGFGAEVKRRIMIGTYALSAGYYDAYYLKAQKVRTLIKQDFEGLCKTWMCWCAPPPPRLLLRRGKRWTIPSVCTCSI
jgi:aspartyl-tRNA(Asn)/glutamyl-tRNA(Gln) amidotransferase subunit A